MKHYLAGPMSGYPELNIPAFTETAKRLRREGYDIVSPAECDEVPIQEAVSWHDWMVRDIGLLLECRGVFVLPGWEKSKGASLEVHIARSLGWPIKCAVSKGLLV